MCPRGGELHKISPVTFDHVDVTRLLKDITSVKASLAEMQLKFEASQNTISELRSEVVLLRNATAVSRSPDTSNVNARRGAQNASLCSFESAKLDASSPAAELGNASNSLPLARPSPPQEEPSRVGTCTPPARAYAAAAAATLTKQAIERKKKSRCEVVHEAAASSLRKDLCDTEGFTVVKRKKKKPACRNRCGTAPTGPNHLLRAAVATTQLYVSRLHFTTKAEDVVQYVTLKTGFRLRVEQLESRHNVNFKSFVVRVPTEHLATFMCEEFWPKSVVYRRFRGKLPSTQHVQRTTT